MDCPSPFDLSDEPPQRILVDLVPEPAPPVRQPGGRSRTEQGLDPPRRPAGQGMAATLGRLLSERGYRTPEQQRLYIGRYFGEPAEEIGPGELERRTMQQLIDHVRLHEPTVTQQRSGLSGRPWRPPSGRYRPGGGPMR